MAYDGVDVEANEAATAEQFNWLKNSLIATAHKEADETLNNDAALQNDDDLAVALLTASYYMFFAHILDNSAANADIKFAFTVPANAVLGWTHIGLNAGGALSAQFIGVSGTATDSYGAAVNWECFLYGVVYTTDTAGNLQLQWAQNTAQVSDTKVLRGSSLAVVRLL